MEQVGDNIKMSAREFRNEIGDIMGNKLNPHMAVHVIGINDLHRSKNIIENIHWCIRQQLR